MEQSRYLFGTLMIPFLACEEKSLNNTTPGSPAEEMA